LHQEKEKYLVGAIKYYYHNK